MWHFQSLKIKTEKIEALQHTVNAQAALISSQTEMMKEINKKLLENEQKLADLQHAKGFNPKRHLEEEENPPAVKKMKS